MFDIEKANRAAAARRLMSPAAMAADIAREGKLYAEERERRAQAAELIAAAAPARPCSLEAIELVTSLGAILGAVVYNDKAGRPCVGIDNNFVAYVVRERGAGDDVVETVDPHVDALLELAAKALGCRWAWTGGTDDNLMPLAISLVAAPAFVAAERMLESRP